MYVKMYLSSNVSCCLFIVATKLKGVDLDAPGNINGVPVLEVDMESFEEKPWRKPGLCVCVCGCLANLLWKKVKLWHCSFSHISYVHLQDFW